MAVNEKVSFQNNGLGKNLDRCATAARYLISSGGRMSFRDQLRSQKFLRALSRSILNSAPQLNAIRSRPPVAALTFNNMKVSASCARPGMYVHSAVENGSREWTPRNDF